MLYLKKLDLFIQFLLPIFGLSITLFSDFWMGVYVGATGIAFSQIMSLILHLSAKKEFWYLKTARSWYSYLLIIQLALEITGIIAFFLTEDGSEFELIFMTNCLTVGTLLTISYWIICWLEIRKIQKKKQDYSI